MIKQISKISFLVWGIFLVNSAIAQTAPPNAKKSDVWTVTYSVSVKGDFKKEAEVGSGGPTTYYHINHQYRGKAKLVYEARPNDPQAALKYPTFKDPATQVDIEINDFWNTFFDPVCDDYKTIEETWKANVSSIFGDEKYPAPAILLINNEKHTYRTSLPILYSCKKHRKLWKFT